MVNALLSYLKALFGLLPQEREYYYFNPEGDFQDIKTLIPIEDSTLIPFAILAIVLLCCIGWGIYRCMHYIQKRITSSRKYIAKNHLIALDTDDGKMCAYEFTRWAHYLVTPTNKIVYETLERDLLKYKYKKGTMALKDEEKKDLQLFVEEIYG